MEVASDPELITLVVQNFIGNAIKYSNKGTVRIRGMCQKGSSKCQISVSDEGPGIAYEHLGRIFEAFQRGDAHGQPGVGLGLAIASQAAKLLGAEVRVESIIGVGSTFTLILPEP
jgi:signal transduction histidine kinase